MPQLLQLLQVMNGEMISVIILRVFIACHSSQMKQLLPISYHNAGVHSLHIAGIHNLHIAGMLKWLIVC
jgi:hypothetical protein